MKKNIWNEQSIASIETETIGIKNQKVKLPIGIQDFKSIRENGYIYIDKTEYIYKLVHYGKPYFLSRPRRFGKSLFLSTLEAYWKGEKELFTGLIIEALEKDNPEAWQAYPVLYIDFNKEEYSVKDALENVLDEHLKNWEKKYNCDSHNSTLSERFRTVIEAAYMKTGKQVVVLIDEYDKPLLDVLDSRDRQDHNKAVFKGFFSTLKSYDKYLKFVFVTGVTKFSKVSIFSDLNHLQDISMDKDFCGICGITERELYENLYGSIQQLAQYTGETYEQCRIHLKNMYDGYRFHFQAVEGIYNPFSIMNALKKREYGEYWFDTGTPTFLIKKLAEIQYDIKRFTSEDYYVSYRKLVDYIEDDIDPLPLLYQTGYITIKKYDKDYGSVILNYPNDEVKYAFLDFLLPTCFENDANYDPTDIRSFGKDIENGSLDSLKKRFQQLFARLPYQNKDKLLEWNYQAVVYIVFMLLGKHIHAEVHTINGRIDCVAETRKSVYIFEFKLNKTSEEAINQIDEKNYADIYKADERTIYEIGVNFDSNIRNINEWDVRILDKP